MKVSVLILAYRMERTIVQTLQAALAQTVPCQIILSDDASPDQTFEVAQAYAATYVGAHSLHVRRNSANQGLCAHIGTLAELATGDIFVFMSGDDISYPHRVARLLQVFTENEDAFAVGSAVDEIDISGLLLRRGAWFLPGPLGQRQLLGRRKLMGLLGASMAVRRQVLAALPPLAGIVEDHMLTLRATLFGRVYCIRESLLGYRRHEGNLGKTIFVRQGAAHAARRQRYERTARMYREVAADHLRCVTAMQNLSTERRRLAEQLALKYQLEADFREAVLRLPKRYWLKPIWRGLQHRALRGKFFERLFKLAIPTRWLVGRI
jgi:glycosyltransferase involved in cell wall biosynthesis